MVQKSKTPSRTDKASTRWSWWWTGRWIWLLKFQIQTWRVKTGGEALNFHIDPEANVIAVDKTLVFGWIVFDSFMQNRHNNSSLYPIHSLQDKKYIPFSEISHKDWRMSISSQDHEVDSSQAQFCKNVWNFNIKCSNSRILRNSNSAPRVNIFYLYAWRIIRANWQTFLSMQWVVSETKVWRREQQHSLDEIVFNKVK